LPEGTRFQVLAPVVRARKGEYVDLFAELQSKGFARARVDGEVVALTDPPKLEKQIKHTSTSSSTGWSPRPRPTTATAKRG
jgi:excinuclease ABC subunit A